MVRTELDEIAEVWRRSPVSAIDPSELLLVTDFDGTMAEIGPDPARSNAIPEVELNSRALEKKSSALSFFRCQKYTIPRLLNNCIQAAVGG